MDSIIKEGETVFHLFIPKSISQVVDNDLAKGTRSTVWHGENCVVYLLARFRGYRHGDAHQIWQSKICQLSAICSVTPKELFQQSDYKSNSKQGQENYRQCKSVIFTSSRDVTNYSDSKCKPSKPIVCKDGDVAFPLTVSLASLHVDTCRAQVTVSLWSPELDYLADCQLLSQDWNDPSNFDFARTFIDDSPIPVMQHLTSAKKYQVNKIISINPSPNLLYRFTKAGAKYYLCLQVQNKSENVIVLDHMQVFSGHINNSNQSENIMEALAGIEAHLVPVTENENEEFPVILQPIESHTFLYDVTLTDSKMELELPQLSLMASLVWSAEPMITQFENITTTFRLFEMAIDRALVTTSSVLDSTHVSIGDRFSILYTINNGKDELKDVSVKWEPESLTTGVNNIIAPARVLLGNSHSYDIVCLTSSIYIGIVPSWSSVTVSIDCLAMKAGVHEVGRCIKLQHAGSLNKEKANHVLDLLHQPCQIYVLSPNATASAPVVKTDTPKINRQWSRESSTSNYSLYGFGEYLKNRRKNESLTNIAGEYKNNETESHTSNDETPLSTALTTIETNDEDQISESSSIESKDVINESTEIKISVPESVTDEVNGLTGGVSKSVDENATETSN
ncbi:Uncharacterized protein C7orf43-like protein [Trichoplax sp. H2]|nr:Uncharacterized protein C7orf43-like protein [Trichoplax sp. H2]|eukprot:RDD46723.1 Uncharacterized protein C7orf43-like protein [Trichoplax sp. H2]